MAVMDEAVYGTGARSGGTANLDAFTGTRWITIRGDTAPYPF
jgi:benzaldehyde dehydrogenase (NAD)